MCGFVHHPKARNMTYLHILSPAIKMWLKRSHFDLSVVLQCPSHLAFPRKFEGWFVLNNTRCKAKQPCEPIILYVPILMVKDFSAGYAHIGREGTSQLCPTNNEHNANSK